MNKKMCTILFSSVFLIIAVVLLLVFLLPKKDDKLILTTNQTVTNSANDIILSVGNKLYNYYELSDKSAKLTFELDKQGIININEEMIEGLKVGEVNVVMTATNKTSTTKKQFKVTVCENEHTIMFESVNNCIISENTIFATANVFQFNVKVKNIENITYDIISNKESTIIDKGFSSVMVITNEDCILTFMFNELNIKISLNVKLQGC